MQMTSPWSPTSKSREELLKTTPIIGGNCFPCIVRLVDIEINPENPRQYRQVVVPASMEDLYVYWKDMDTFQVDGNETDEKSRMQFARKVAAELWQESWIAGIPESETIFCAACQQPL